MQKNILCLYNQRYNCINPLLSYLELRFMTHGGFMSTFSLTGLSCLSGNGKISQNYVRHFPSSKNKCWVCVLWACVQISAWHRKAEDKRTTKPDLLICGDEGEGDWTIFSFIEMVIAWTWEDFCAFVCVCVGVACVCVSVNNEQVQGA